jgi:hypothetical protein
VAIIRTSPRSGWAALGPLSHASGGALPANRVGAISPPDDPKVVPPAMANPVSWSDSYRGAAESARSGRGRYRARRRRPVAPASRGPVNRSRGGGRHPRLLSRATVTAATFGLVCASLVATATGLATAATTLLRQAEPCDGPDEAHDPCLARTMWESVRGASVREHEVQADDQQRAGQHPEDHSSKSNVPSSHGA